MLITINPVFKYGNKHQGKQLKPYYLHCYTRFLCEIWWVRTCIYQEKNVYFDKWTKLLEQLILREYFIIFKTDYFKTKWSSSNPS